MFAMNHSSISQILKKARTILLVDWSSRDVPRALVEAGFTVFCSSPGRYSLVQVVDESPADVDAGDVFPAQKGQSGYLVFRKLSESLPTIDIVNVYRPENEHTGIVENHVLPFGAKTLWLQPSVASAEARRLAGLYGLDLIEGIDIAEAARLLE
jgi:predicted CoA-binding protein